MIYSLFERLWRPLTSAEQVAHSEPVGAAELHSSASKAGAPQKNDQHVFVSAQSLSPLPAVSESKEKIPGSSESLWQICQRLTDTMATCDDISAIMNAMVAENATFTAALRSYSYRWSDVCFHVLDNLENIGFELAREITPLCSLHKLFLGCEEYLLNARRYESHASGSYNYMVRVIQSFAARQWSLHAREIEDSNAAIYDSLFLFQGPSKFRSATTYALQSIEDLKPIKEGDVVEFMFKSHDAVRNALGIYKQHIMTLKDFQYYLGDRGWQGLGALVSDFVETRLPQANTEDSAQKAITLLRNSNEAPSGLQKCLLDDKLNHLVLKTVNTGFKAMRQLACAETALETAAGLASITDAAVQLAGLRPPSERSSLKIVGEDERVFILSILLQSSSDMIGAVKHAMMAYICTPYVGGEVDQSRAQSVFVALGQSLI